MWKRIHLMLAYKVASYPRSFASSKQSKLFAFSNRAYVLSCAPTFHVYVLLLCTVLSAACSPSFSCYSHHFIILRFLRHLIGYWCRRMEYFDIFHYFLTFHPTHCSNDAKYKMYKYRMCQEEHRFFLHCLYCWCYYLVLMGNGKQDDRDKKCVLACVCVHVRQNEWNRINERNVNV